VFQPFRKGLFEFFFVRLVDYLLARLILSQAIWYKFRTLLLFNHEYVGIVKRCEIIWHVDISKAFFILLFMYHSEHFLECSVCLRLVLFLAYIFWGREFAQTFATSIIKTALLSHQWSKACSQSTMPGDRNSTLWQKQHTLYDRSSTQHTLCFVVCVYVCLGLM